MRHPDDNEHVVEFAVVLSMDASLAFACWVMDCVPDDNALDPLEHCMVLEEELGQPLNGGPA